MASAVKIEPADVGEDVGSQDAANTIDSKLETYIEVKHEMDIESTLQQKPIHDSISLDMANYVKIEPPDIGEDVDSQDAANTIDSKLETYIEVKHEMDIESIVQQKPIHDSSSLAMTSAIKIEPSDFGEDVGSQNAASTIDSKLEANIEVKHGMDFWFTIPEKTIHDNSSLNMASSVKIEPPDVGEDICSEDAASTAVIKLEATADVKQEMDIEPPVLQKPDIHFTRRPRKHIDETPAQTCSSEEMQLGDVIRRRINENSTPTTSMMTNPSTHARRSRGRSTLYCCGICNKTFTKKQYLQKHMSIHIEQKSVSCSVCSKYFISKSDLAKHKLIHIGKDPHCCNICNKSFTKKFNLTSHMSIHSGQKPHSCNTCGKNFTKKSSLIRHTLVHSKDKPYPCGICSKSFSEKSKLENHMLIHAGEKPHCCNICNKSFSIKSNLKKHILIHSGEKPHCCNICSKSFSDKGNLIKHMFVHSGQKPHCCNICNKSFSQKCNLTTHMLVHSGYKPHRCNICSKTFSQLGSLTHHMLIHTGQKEHTCNICGKSFRQKGNLTTHMLIHLGST